MRRQADDRASGRVAPVSDPNEVWVWQETLTHEGTHAECMAAHASFAVKKNGAHFVMGKKSAVAVKSTPIALKSAPKRGKDKNVIRRGAPGSNQHEMKGKK